MTRVPSFLLLGGLLGAVACAPATTTSSAPMPAPGPAATAPNPDPRVGLRAGLFDAGEAVWNMRVLSKTPPPEPFVGATNSDLAFMGPYAIQGNYNGIIVWDISNPQRPTPVTQYVCPASQNDVSVYRNLLFVSGEGMGGRLDCGTQGIREAVSKERLRGIRIFDISDIRNPKYIHNVQTCRGSHTHTVLEHPGDREAVYVYVSGSSTVRSAEELPGCSGADPEEDASTALFRIEVIRVPLADPTKAAIVSSPRIFSGLMAPPRHGMTPAEQAVADAQKAAGAFYLQIGEQTRFLPDRMTSALLDSLVMQRGGSGAPTGADSAALRQRLAAMSAQMTARREAEGPRPGPDQCHDITVYPAIGLAGGACEGYGLLLDISDPANPRRIAAVSDSNFSYWHSATFSNDGTKILFTDEWGGGGGAKCRDTDPMEWGANAIFTIENRQMRFRSYYKLPAVQTSEENCVAHNGSMIPIPGRDVMVQGWYQGGVSVFDWTDPANPVEIAFFDRGPVDAQRMRSGGSWSVYWYNGVIVSSEIARGLDIMELTPSSMLSQNEIDAAKSVRLQYFNAQGQPQYTWPATFSLARAYVDQLERSRGLSAEQIGSVRQQLGAAERASGSARRDALSRLADDLTGEAGRSADGQKVRMLVEAVRRLGT